MIRFKYRPQMSLSWVWPEARVGIFIYFNREIGYVADYDLKQMPSDIEEEPNYLDNRKIWKYLFTVPIKHFERRENW
jgi:hypothetical protein